MEASPPENLNVSAARGESQCAKLKIKICRSEDVAVVEVVVGSYQMRIQQKQEIINTSKSKNDILL